MLEVPLRLESGKTESIDIDVSKGPVLTGEVRGPDDKPLSDVSVVVRAKAGRAIAYGAVTDGEGRYSIRGMPPGAYTLEAKRWAVRTGPG